MLHCMLYLGFVLVGVGLGISVGIILDHTPNMSTKKINWIIKIISAVGAVMAVCSGRMLEL